MALPVLTDVFRTTFNWSDGAGHTAHNVLHLWSPGGNVAGVLADLNTGLASVAAASHLFWPLASVWTCSTVDILPLDGSATTTTGTISPTQTGGASGASVFQTAGVVSLYTGQRGSRGRGRLYLGPVGEDGQASGLLTPAGRTTCQTAWTTFIANMNLAGTIPVVASYTHSDHHTITSAVVQPYIATQRRRARFLQ